MADCPLPFSPATDTTPPRVFIIAELGVNHDGELTRGLELVDVAHRAGADAIKLQYFDPDQLLSADARLATYQQAAAADPHDLLESLTLSFDAIARLRDAARHAAMYFIVTPFSLADVHTLKRLEVDAVKIASPDAVNTPLLDAAASLDKPMLISTGTCELNELIPAADRLSNYDAGGALLQCVSSYPAPDDDAALGGIAALADRFHLPVGYSDHTAAVDTGALAVAAGACVLEKHLTYDIAAAGPDHAASLSPDDFSRYVQAARRAARMLGPRAKRRLPVEADVHTVSRQSWCATRDLPAGHVLQQNDVIAKRPGTGIPAAEHISGRSLVRDVTANHLLHWEDLGEATK